MSQKWNLQDIKPAGQPTRRRRKKPVTKQTQPEVADTINIEPAQSVPIEDGRQTSRRNIWLTTGIAIAVVAGAVFLSTILGKTELTIYPQYRDPNISASFTAYPEARDEALRYEIMTIEETSESQVQASGKIEVEELATGRLEIKKTTPGAERLIKNTRFRSPNGFVFRIEESVVVPGAVTNSEGELVPGTIQAPVFADDVGEKYNLAAGTTFTVPGFQENGFTALYEAITASNPAAMSGGFAGPQFKIDDSELSTARQALQLELRERVLSAIESQKPAGMTAFPGAVAITYTQLPAVEYGSDLVTIREQATLQIPLFKDAELAAFLANEAIATYEGGAVRLDDPQALTFAYEQATTSSSVIANAESLGFTLTGKPRIIWEYDAKKLTTDLSGLPKTALKNAIAAYPGIEGAKAHITPFWKRTFPENAEDIVVIEELRTGDE